MNISISKWIAIVLVLLGTGSIYFKSFEVTAFILVPTIIWLIVLLKAERKERVRALRKIESEEQALSIIRSATNAFYALFGIQLVLAGVLAFYVADLWLNVVAALVMLFFTFRLRKKNSRAAVIIIGIVVIIFIVIGVINAFKRGYPGGALIINIAVLWELFRVEKALKLIGEQKRHQKHKRGNIIKPTRDRSSYIDKAVVAENRYVNHKPASKLPSFRFKKSTILGGIVLLAVLVLMGGWFYWHEYRPSQIKKECHEAAIRLKNYARYEKTFGECLNEKGL